MKFFIHNYNTCTRVKLYGEDVKSTFIINNHQLVNEERDAELIIVNTCSFLKTKEDYFIKLLKEINDRKVDNQRIVVVGCLAGVNKQSIMDISTNILCFGRSLDEIREYFSLDILPPAKASQVEDELPFKKKLLYYFNRIFLHSKHIEYRLKRNRVCYLQISTGCMGKCSYCSERFTTILKSRTINEILEAIEDGINRGYKLFALNSDDASAYGKDINLSLDMLLSEVTKFKDNIHFSIPEFNPQGIIPTVQRLLYNDKFLYITVPIQSGSQRILDLMHRPYKIEHVLKVLKDIKLHNKKLKINTHIIVGFPGESEKDFQKTREVLETGIFDRVKVFKFSERPNTEAILLPNKISEEIKERRKKELLKIIKKINIRNISLTNLILNKEQIK